MADKKPNVAVPAPLIDALMRYLNTKPHGEVRNLIDSIGACKVIEEDADDRHIE